VRRFRPNSVSILLWVLVIGLTAILVAYAFGWITLDDNVPIRG
jgi:hypothetical protein